MRRWPTVGVGSDNRVFHRPARRGTRRRGRIPWSGASRRHREKGKKAASRDPQPSPLRQVFPVRPLPSYLWAREAVRLRVPKKTEGPPSRIRAQRSARMRSLVSVGEWSRKRKFATILCRGVKASSEGRRCKERPSPNRRLLKTEVATLVPNEKLRRKGGGSGLEHS